MAVKKVGLVTLEHIIESGDWKCKSRTARTNEIFFIVSGSITVAENFSRFTLFENDVFCSRKGSVYQLYKEGDQPLDMYRLSFMGEYGTIQKQFTMKDTSVISEVLKVADTIISREGYPKNAFDAVCELILAELSFASLPETVKNDTAASALLGWIEENKHKNIKVRDAAEHFGLSEGYLTRTFKESYSWNLKNYIDSIRQKYVCEQLEDLSLSLSEVASRCGFDSYRQLNTFMNYHLGMSPSEYRKNKQKWNRD